jgi:hypothetical protein
MLPPSKSIVIITFAGSRLGSLHLTQLGISALERIQILGAPEDGHLRGIIRDGAEYVHEIERELVDCTRKMVEKHGSVGAVVLECTQMPPFAEAIQRAVGLSVYDVYSRQMFGIRYSACSLQFSAAGQKCRASSDWLSRHSTPVSVAYRDKIWGF